MTMSLFRKLINLARPRKSAPAPAGNREELFSWQVDSARRYLAWLPDPDQVLNAAGKTRAKLGLMLTDPAIKQAVDTRRDALVGAPWYLTPSEGTAPALIWDNLNDVIGEVMACCFQALLFGFSVAERVYSTDPKTGLIVLKAIRNCPIQEFVFDSQDNLKRLIDGVPHEVDTQFKYLLTRHNPTVDNPYGDALLAALYWNYVYRVNTSRFMMMYLERVGIPLLVGHSSSNLEEMKERMAAAYQDSVLAVDSEAKVEFAGTSTQNQQFTGVLTELNREIVTLILGGTLTSGTDGGSGNRALGQVHDNVRLDKRDADIKMVKASVQNVIDALAALNGFGGEVPLISFGSRKNLNQEQASRDALLLNSGALKFTRAYFEDEYNFDSNHIFLPEPKGEALESQRRGLEASSAAARPGQALKAAESLTLAAQRFDGGPMTRLDSLARDLAALGPVIDSAELEAVVLAAEDAADLNRRLGELALKAALAQPAEELAAALLTAETLGQVEAQ